MKNKGRKQLSSRTANCKGRLVGITRNITSMSNRHNEGYGERGYSKKFLKKSWSKRIRGYFKSKTKESFNISNLEMM